MKTVSRPMHLLGLITGVVDSAIAPVIPIYLYSTLEILISVTLFTLTSGGSLDVSFPKVALYPDLPIALVPLVFYLFKQWSPHKTPEPGSFVCKEEILDQEEDNMNHTRVGDDDSTNTVGQSGGNTSNMDDRETTETRQKPKTQHHVVHEEDDDLGMRRNELAVWPSLTPNPGPGRREQKKPQVYWDPGMKNDTRGWVKEHHSGSVQVEVEVDPSTSSVPPPWELGNASARSRLR
ncbi:hypothetical protein FE257_007524 [Aspergillus nanangensis]|uniref:Uncharacterized protein n=1 Tax=Aspergillus nanangensis TaxID=2582783 RepID=A0AAD4GU16_ASPNN|nr:hypothetical protein FE257_007524 [Aspergillus nanangensis]